MVVARPPTLNVSENTTAVTTVTATDADVSDTLTYSIVGGADAALFSINSSTGALTFNTAPDFETPGDAGADNVYDVTVQVSDGNGGTDTQAIAVTVTDLNGTVSLDLDGDEQQFGCWWSIPDQLERKAGGAVAVADADSNACRIKTTTELTCCQSRGPI